MADIVSPDVRSRMMSGIRSKNTKPELTIRGGLHRRGFRFRLFDKTLPGKPDLVFPKYKAVILVHGCFWHGHECHLFRWPKTRQKFWKEKIGGNRARDESNVVLLEQQGWRCLTVWECAIRNQSDWGIADVLDRCEKWLTSGVTNMEIDGL